MKIIIYYHLTLINNWETVLREQCSCIIFSGLYDIIHSIRCYAIDVNGDQETICRNLLQNYGLKFSLERVERSGTEWLTLKNIKDREEDENVTEAEIRNKTKTLRCLPQDVKPTRFWQT